MRILKSIVNLLIFGNLYVAVPITCLTHLTFLMNDATPSTGLLLMVSGATLFLYVFHRLYGLNRITEHDLGDRHRWALENRMAMLGILGLSGAIGLAGVLQVPFETLYWLAPAAVVSLLYTIPVIPAPGHWKRLRDLPYAKVFLIAFTVSYVTVVLPGLFIPGAPLEKLNHLMPQFVNRMIFILAITIPFDIRDVNYDKKQKLVTLPVKLGVRQAIVVSQVAMVLFLAHTIFAMPEHIAGRELSVALIASAVYGMLVINASRPDRSEYFYSFLLEGAMIVQWGLFWLLPADLLV